MRVVDDVVTNGILRCALRVSRSLGVGFAEKVYENAMMVEFKRNGICAAQQASIKVKYAGQVVGVYVSDLVVEQQVIAELKCKQEISNIDQAQLLNYLRATGLTRGLILNFGTPRLGIKRMVL